MAEVDGEAVVSAGDKELELEAALVDRVSKELLVTLAIR